MDRNLIALLRVPYGKGGERPGAEQGPDALLKAGLVRHLSQLGLQTADEGAVLPPTATDGSTPGSGAKLKHLEEIAALNSELADRVAEVAASGRFPLILGGDHSIAIGTIAGLTRHYRHLGVIWFDAHGDLNTEDTSPSGNIHGMSLAVNLGQGHPLLMQIRRQSSRIDPAKVVIIGARSLDEGERAYIRQAGITCFTMHDIDRKGMPYVMEQALRILGDGTDGVHLSFDIDSLDPAEAPGTGTPIPGGVSYREAHLALEMMYESGLITSAEFVEVSPPIDSQKRTVRLAIGLIGSLLGERIL
ncbi:arginase [Paenibacillus melissococcoides]|uniref:Arginase n=1 Tax=Paenibacillus melissococcoides TaxID=2912268 RepID=A0ABM9G8S3_9BACL|nr:MULTISPECIES: arginase [Paenibacillus]MEB9897362.1 arginase [Bacillus cereus]CAH8248384.1 arginase [Paenibacillus melissococcoides]CAH8717646.1 arginase [Paenibacillus melissococcoides]CAH8719475.1 arginase [Paenibacillus melissococcoides]GIO77187.1 arginase [Paenibacillus dendritiformis]